MTEGAPVTAPSFGHGTMNDFPIWLQALFWGLVGGAALVMLADTMVPEAYESAHNYSGFITTLGFMLAFVLSKLGQ